MRGNSVASADELAKGFTVFSYAGKYFDTPPAKVVIGVLFEIKPLVIRRLLALVGSDRAVISEFVKINTVGSGVIENSVKNYMHTAFF